MSFKIHFRDHFFFYSIILLVIIVSVISYYRFIIKDDYIVGYEGECDPAIESCFVGCEDDECIDEYYYSKVQKYAPDLFSECGPDITDCVEASVCLPTDQECSVIYCDPEIDGDACSVPVSVTVDEPSIDTDTLLEEVNQE